jgi:hypothetical protein
MPNIKVLLTADFQLKSLCFILFNTDILIQWVTGEIIILLTVRKYIILVKHDSFLKDPEGKPFSKEGSKATISPQTVSSIMGAYVGYCLQSLML